MTPPTMKNRIYWKQYAHEANPDEIGKNIKLTGFNSDGQNFELIYFEKDKKAPSILVAPGSGAHAYVYAELGYFMYLNGYNVFIMPKHGSDHTIEGIMRRCGDALKHIVGNFNERVGIVGGGLGGFAAFYLALANGPMKSVVCEDSPAILTEKKFQEAVTEGDGAAKRRRMFMPLLKILTGILPKIKIPLSLYLSWNESIDTKEKNRKLETYLVEKYQRDPDFDKRYTLSSVMSLVSTPPPFPLETLKIPTMFLCPIRGFAPSYVKDLYGRLPAIKKKLVEVDGGIFYFESHPKEAAEIICRWFNETL